MNAILATTAPVFALIGIGYLVVRLDLLAQSAARQLGWFVMHLALPALLIKALAGRQFEQVLDAPFLLAYGGATLAVLLLAVAVLRLLRRKTLTQAAVMALGMAQPNSAFIGLPIILSLLGDPALLVFALILVLENTLIIPTALILADAGGGEQRGARVAIAWILKRLARNPLVIAVLIGMGLSASGLALPAPVLRGLDLLGSAATPLALFVIGATLVGVRPGGLIGDALQVLAGKLLLHPLAVAAVLLLVPGLSATSVQAGILIAACPMLSIYAVVGQRYDAEQMCALALLLTTLAAFITLNLVIWLLGLPLPPA